MILPVNHIKDISMQTSAIRGKPEGKTAPGRALRQPISLKKGREMARVTGLEPATSGVTGRHSNRLSYTRALSATRQDRVA